jgi:TrmH RNA methyltransferase
MARVENEHGAIRVLRDAGHAIAATVPREGEDIYSVLLPSRTVFVFGAESEGMTTELIAAADMRLTIPGSGIVESLNIAASAAVVLGEFWRQLHASYCPHSYWMLEKMLFARLTDECNRLPPPIGILTCACRLP